MKAASILSFVFAVASYVPHAAAAGSVCSSGIYAVLAPLSTYPPAESYCSSKYPASTVTVTIAKRQATTPRPTPTTTTTTTTTTTKPTTSTAITTTKPISTTTTKALSTTTNKPPSTTTTTKTSTTLSTSTTTQNLSASLWSSALAQASSIISTLCSCINPPSTVTKTSTTTTTTTTTTKPPTTTTTTTTTTKPTTSPTTTTTASPTTTTTTTTTTPTTTTTTTTPTTTTTTTTTISTSPTPTNNCQNGPYTASNFCGCDYEFSCDGAAAYGSSANILGTSEVSGDGETQVQSCAETCDGIINCVSFSNDVEAGTCTFYDEGLQSGAADDSYNYGQRQLQGGDTSCTNVACPSEAVSS